MRSPMVTDNPERVVAEHRALLQAAVAGDLVTFAVDLRAHQTHTPGFA
ncbi:hypothetical protein [Mycolicibacterium goodii]|nr:hypothetical protein [Mycolicibacterium goodii]MBU8833287.1 hypothetical protein [Mycolicibacterium goodii]